MSVMSEWLYPRIRVGGDEDYLSSIVTEGNIDDLVVLFTDVGLMMEQAAVDLWRSIRITQEGHDLRWTDWHAQMLRTGMMFYECLDGISPIAAFEGYRHGFSTRTIAAKMHSSQTSVRRWISQEQQRRRPPAQHVFRQRWQLVTPPAEWEHPAEVRPMLPDDADMPGPGRLSRREGLPPEPRPVESVRRSAPVMREYRQIHRIPHVAQCAVVAPSAVSMLATGDLLPSDVGPMLLHSVGWVRSCRRVMAREILVASRRYFSRRRIAEDLGLSRRAVDQWHEDGQRVYGQDNRWHEQWQNGEVECLPSTWIDRRAEKIYHQFLEANGQTVAGQTVAGQTVAGQTVPG